MQLIIIAIAAAALFGAGYYDAYETQQARINASIALAHAIDKKALDDVTALYKSQVIAGQAREKLSNERLVEYAKSIKTNGRPECSLDDGDIKYLGGVR